MNNAKFILFGLLFLLSITVKAQVRPAKVQGQNMLEDSISSVAWQQWMKDSLAILSWSDSLMLTINNQSRLQELAVRHTIDSLQVLQLPTGKYQQQLDSLAYKKESLLSEITARKNDLSQQTKIRLQEWQNALKARLGLHSPEHHTGMNIPTTDLTGSPNEPPILNNLAIGSLEADPHPDLPALSVRDFHNMELSIDLASLQETLPFNGVKVLKNVQEKVTGIRKHFSQATFITKDPGQAIKEEVKCIEKLSALQEDIKPIGELSQNEFLQSAKQLEDPKALKKSAQKEIIKEAVNHFKGREDRLKQAVEKMAQYKQKYAYVSSIHEMPKKGNNEMKGPSFKERLLPGIAFQIYRQEGLLIDFNPYLGVRLTDRLTAGLGWNKRFVLGKWNQANYKSEIYGPRAFTEFSVWKGFSPRLEIEYLSCLLPINDINAPFDINKREWVLGSKIGIKKEYQLWRNVKGTAIIMVKFFNPGHHNPDKHVLNMRFGLEFPIKN